MPESERAPTTLPPGRWASPSLPCSLCNKPTVGTAFSFEGGHYLHDACRDDLAGGWEARAREAVATAIEHHQLALVAEEALESTTAAARRRARLAALNLARVALELADTP